MDRATDMLIHVGFSMGDKVIMRNNTYIQNPNNLRKMNKNLPVFFVAGEADPVGNYGAGVRESASRFQQIGMTQVALKLYALCRHEILNELNKEQVYHDLLNWILAIIK